MDLSFNRLDMKNSVEHPRRKSREAVMMALYALEIHNNVNEKSETSSLPSADGSELVSDFSFTLL